MVVRLRHVVGWLKVAVWSLLLGACSAGDGETAETRQGLCSGTRLTANPSGPADAGVTVALAASGTTCGGATPEYRFVYLREGTSAYVQIRDWGTSQTATWSTTGLASGKYQLLAYTRGVGTTALSAGRTVFLVNDVCTSATLMANPKGPMAPGASVALSATASCSGSASPEFRFAVNREGESTWSELAGWGSGSASWDTTGFPPSAYNVIVYTRAIGNTSGWESARHAKVTLGDACTAASVTAFPNDPVELGTTVALTASATCSAGSPEFRFHFQKQGDPTWTAISDWGAATVDWPADGPSGTHVLRAEARMIGSTGGAQAVGYLTYRIGEVCTAVTLSTSSPSPQSAGTNLTLLANATCTSGSPEYRFSMKSPGSTTWTLLEDWGESSITWNTSSLASGNYALRVLARASGNTSSAESAGYVQFTLTPAGCFGGGECELGEQCSDGQSAEICLAPRDLCLSNSDCKRHEYCNAANQCVVAAGLGQTCSTGNRCGLASGTSGQLWCESGVCVGPLAPGAACYGSYQCDDGFACGLDIGAGYSVCLSVPVQDGYCDGDEIVCAEGYFCDLNSFLTQCKSLSGFGKPCNSLHLRCAPGLYCSKGSCAASPDEGKPCVTGASPCATDHYCDPTKTCRVYGAIGDDCTSRVCGSDSYCDSTTQICVPRRLHGEVCAGAACASGLRCVTGHVGGSCGP